MFAGQAIPRDAFVIEYTGEVIPHSLAGESGCLAALSLKLQLVLGLCLWLCSDLLCLHVRDK